MKINFSFYKLFSVLLLSALSLSCVYEGGDFEGGGSNASCEAGSREFGTGEFEATIPEGLVGTYSLTFREPISAKTLEAPAESAPYSEGDQVDFEVKADGTLIVGGDIALCDPVLYSATGKEADLNPAEAIWFDEENGLGYALTNLETEELNEINLSNNLHWTEDDFVFLGQFSNKK